MVLSGKDNPPGFTKDTSYVSNQYGKLVWPRFYGSGVYYSKHGKYDNVVIMSVLRSEWIARKKEK